MSEKTQGGSMRTNRTTSFEMSPDAFRKLGHDLIDQIADFLATLPNRQVTPAEDPAVVRSLVGVATPLPDKGTSPQQLFEHATQLLFNHSTFNGHPRFWGYITAGPTPIGILGDLLAAAVNPNCGGWKLSPIATEIELQTIRWVADLIGYPTDCGGLLVSGGNMANFIGFLAARVAKSPWNVREKGFTDPAAKRMVVFTSAETHTWIHKATDLFGLGTDNIRWIPTDSQLRMDMSALRRHIKAEEAAGNLPFMVVGTGGSVSTGAVDPLYEIAGIAREHNLWFHVDGAYGGFAAQTASAPEDLRGLSEADSVAIDPHKWLYAPLEAGCALVRRPEDLTNAFSYLPPYYHFQDDRENMVNYGVQNSRGFRALKVWLALQQAGRSGHLSAIEQDIALSKEMFRCAQQEPDIETFTQGLSIATFRYIPSDLREKAGELPTQEYLNQLNEEIMIGIEKSGEAFVSHAVLDGKFVLRACIVNFQTTVADVQALPPLVVRLGKVIDARLRAGAPMSTN